MNAVLPEGVTFQRVWYLDGTVPKNLRDNWPVFEVNNPPCSGHSHAFVIAGARPARGSRRKVELVTLFHPYTLESAVVASDAGELEVKDQASAEMTPERLDGLVDIIRSKWEFFQKHAKEKDYDVAALLLRKLGREVPEQLIKGGEVDTRVKGGKGVGTALLKPVKLQGKRGKFLAWFLEADSASRSVRECMAEFGMGRSNVLSYLFILNKDHGIGYALVGEEARIELPAGCDSPFDEPVEDDDSWLD